MDLNTGVWDRSGGQDTLSSGVYNLIIGLVLFYGFLINAYIVSRVDPNFVAGVSPWLFYIGYFASCLFGSFLFTKSSNPLISFVGYNFVVVPFGFILTQVLNGVSTDIIYQAIESTAVVTLIMSVLGFLYPKAFFKIKTALFWSLLAVVIVELVMVFILNIHHPLINWIVVLIMCGYIGYDFAKANAIPKTLDNAIDSAANLYMSIIILFIRLISILRSR